MNSKLIDNVSVPKRSSRNSESHTKKVLGGNMRFCRNGTKNWLHCVENETSMTRIRRKRWNW